MKASNNIEQYPDRVSILIEIHAKEGQEEIARKAFTTTIATSEKPGLLSYAIYEDSKDPAILYSLQEWENAEAFHNHMSAAKSGMKEATSMLRDAPRTSVLNSIAKANWDPAIK